MNIEQVMAWLAGPFGKVALLAVGGFLLKRWEPFINKAIPSVLMGVSLLMEVLRAMFPALVPDANAATMFAAVMQEGPMWQRMLMNTVLPVVFAVGMQSGAKNTAEWWRVGFKMFQAVRR